jgi:VIT1/CCC1 family predicted Fe2+/Mn2+ transporter
MDAMKVFTVEIAGRRSEMFLAQSWWRSGLETVVIGGTAAALAYVIGAALGGVA